MLKKNNFYVLQITYITSLSEKKYSSRDKNSKIVKRYWAWTIRSSQPPSTLTNGCENE